LKNLKTSRKRSILLIIIVFLFSCNSENEQNTVNINQEISSLSNYSEKNDYLEMILDLDQNIRRNNDAELQPGSKAERAHYLKMDSIDRLNFERIDLYLNTYGYPKKDSVSSNASMAPWIVIHHSNYNKRIKHFNVLIEAYKTGDIDLTQFDFYLGRTYQMKFGEYPTWEGPYKLEEKVEWMIQELGLE
jgi:hypothetical protein